VEPGGVVRLPRGVGVQAHASNFTGEARKRDIYVFIQARNWGE